MVDYCTVSCTVVLCVLPPPVPVMVSTLVPTPVLLRVEMVSVEVPEPVTDVGLNVAVVRLGSPVTLNVTVLLNPFTFAIVTV